MDSQEFPQASQILNEQKQDSQVLSTSESQKSEGRKEVNLMVDLETWGKRPSSVILEIAMVEFNQDTWAGQNFHVKLDPRSQTMRSIEPDTVLWWMDQIQNHGGQVPNYAMPLRQALGAFVGFINSFKKQNLEPVIWAQGTDFDISILKDVLGRTGFDIPWKYNMVRDARTLRALFPEYGMPTGFIRGQKHNALEDAKAQAAAVWNILKGLDHDWNKEVK